jgi:chromosome segregation ATPase
MMRQERKSRDQLTEQQEEALAATHAQLEEKETAVAALQAAGQELRTGIGELLAAKETAEAQQLASRQEVGVLLDRASSLEAALQASVQHSSEQEQSLLRWQQLADDTAAQVQMLQEEVTSLRGQLEAAEAELDGLRLRRLQQEEEGQKAEAGLQEKEAALQQQAERFRQTDGALKDALAEIEELRRSHGTGALGSARELIRTREQVSALDEELAAAQEVSRQLAEALALADDTAEAQREQLLWYKVNQDSSSQELDRARQQALQAEEQATQLKSALDEAQGREGLMETELRQLQERVDEAAAGYEAMLKSKEAQLNARDRELERLLQELDAQGQRLAQLQATLVERELELNESQARTAEEQRRLQERLKEQANLIYRMKQVTSARIAQLEAQLAQAQAGAGERANNE